MKQKILGILMVVMGMVGMNALAVMPVAAAPANDGKCGASTPLGFRPWYYGLCGADDEIAQPDNSDEQNLIAFIWTIILNVLFDMMIAVAYIALGFIVYAGIQIVMSQGDPGKLAKGKHTLTSAIIGTIIAMVASVAVNTVRVILGINMNDHWAQNELSQDQVTGAFNWVYSIAGVIAVIFIIKGGLDYLLSSGDPGKVRKATQEIIYAVVGLVVALLAAGITNLVINSTGGAL